MTCVKEADALHTGAPTMLAQQGRGGLDARSGAFTVDERRGEGGLSPPEAQA